MATNQSTATPADRPRQAARIVFACATCGTIVNDYASNRRKTNTGKRYCSAACRIVGTRTSVLVRKTESKCVRCGEVKPLDEFYSDAKCKANGGVQYTCKTCIKEVRQQHYDENSQRVIERTAAYAKTHHDVVIRHSKKQRAKSTKEERAARRHLNAEVNRGNVVKPEACEACGNTAKLHGHHHLGYEPPFWLDVVWLCVSCHHAAHGRGPKARRLAEAKGSPAIDHEDVLIVRKPDEGERVQGD